MLEQGLFWFIMRLNFSLTLIAVYNRQCLQNGILVLLGLAGGNLSLSTLDTVFRGVTIKGSEAGDKRLVFEVLSLLAQNKAGLLSYLIVSCLHFYLVRLIIDVKCKVLTAA